MSIARLFRPGPGMVHESYTAAWTEEAIYPGDWTTISIVAPTLQGSTAGTIDGKTAASTDFVYVSLADDDDQATPGLQLGPSMGNSLTHVSDWSDVSGEVSVADQIIIVQNWGVHPNVPVDDTDAAVGDYITSSTDAGGSTASSTINASGHGDYGIALTVDAAYTRATAADALGCVAWVYKF